MARIIKARGRKPVAEGPAGAGVANYREDGGLTFRVRIGDHTAVLTHSERDAMLASWAKSETEFEQGKAEPVYTMVVCSKAGGYRVETFGGDPWARFTQATGGDDNTITAVLYDAEGDMVQAYANPSDFKKG